MSEKMVFRKTWDEFRGTKLLWWVNRTLHLFGWAIVVECDIENDMKVIDAYPARVKFRGFDEKSEEEGFIGLSEYLEKNISEIKEECMNEDTQAAFDHIKTLYGGLPDAAAPGGPPVVSEQSSPDEANGD